MESLSTIDTRKLTQEELKEAIEQNKAIYTEHYDLNFVKSLVDNVLSVIDETYFRSVFIGFKNMPERNNPDHPLIYASNHSGMSFPWDAIIFGSGLLKKHNYDTKKSVRALTSPMLSKTTLMNPFLMRNVWKRVGGVDATTLNFETMMHYQDSELLIYPEGVPGIGKGFNRKYQLQPFSTSILRMSIKYRTDVIPYATINGEYINPYVYSFTWINNITAKVGIPFLPIGLVTPLVLLQPWVFYMAFPAKMFFVMGERIKPYEMIDKAYEDVTREDLLSLGDKIHKSTQKEVDLAVEKWGQEPYQMKEFWKRFFKNIKKFPLNMPFAWPLIFTDFERQYNKQERTGKDFKLNYGRFSTLRMLIMNPITICYFIPIIGWIPLLIKGYRNNRLDGA